MVVKDGSPMILSPYRFPFLVSNERKEDVVVKIVFTNCLRPFIVLIPPSIFPRDL